MAFKISRLHSLKTQLFTVFWALTVALLYYAISSILSDWRQLKSLDDVADAQKIAITSGSLAHELQKERGLSAGFISSRGERFGDALRSQRQLSDQVFKEFEALQAEIDVARLGDSVRGKLDASLKAMKQLAETRRAIDALQLQPPASFAYYSNTIDQLLDMVTESGKISD